MTPEHATAWDAMTPEERRKLVRRNDTSMRSPQWRPLLDRMANSTAAQLTPLQAEAMSVYLKGMGK